jgi:hypothetical protein
MRSSSDIHGGTPEQICAELDVYSDRGLQYNTCFPSILPGIVQYNMCFPSILPGIVQSNTCFPSILPGIVQYNTCFPSILPGIVQDNTCFLSILPGIVQYNTCFPSRPAHVRCRFPGAPSLKFRVVVADELTILVGGLRQGFIIIRVFTPYGV